MRLNTLDDVLEPGSIRENPTVESVRSAKMRMDQSANKGDVLRGNEARRGVLAQGYIMKGDGGDKMVVNSHEQQEKCLHKDLATQTAFIFTWGEGDPQGPCGTVPLSSVERDSGMGGVRHQCCVMWYMECWPIITQDLYCPHVSICCSQ